MLLPGSFTIAQPPRPRGAARAPGRAAAPARRGRRPRHVRWAPLPHACQRAPRHGRAGAV